MPHQPQHQFDPVAASAIAALNSSQRAQRSLRQSLGAPEPPGIEGAFNQSRSVLQQASSLAPLNVLASPNGPSLPGFGGGGQQNVLGNLPTPDQFLPGMQGAGQQSPIPTPQQLLPGMGQNQQFPPTPGGGGGGGGGSGGSNGGASESEESADPGRQSSQTRS